MTARLRPTPLSAGTEVEERGPFRAVTSTIVDPEEPLLAGHYPGFPIVPGVCLIECAHRSVLAVDAGLELEAIEATRFLSPVFPGDRITAEVTRAGDEELRWSAAISTVRGPAAEVRLRYRRSP